MITRMTTSMMASSTLAATQQNFHRLADANNKMSSGKRMQFASDDPASSVSSMRLRKELAATEQYKRNIDDAAAWMQTADSSMQTVSGLYRRAKTSLIGSVDAGMGASSLKAYAADLRQQAQSIMTQANATYLGRTVFAGNSDKGAVFRTGTSQGGDTQFMQTEADTVTSIPVNRRINSDTTLPANMDGNKIFGTGTVKFVVDGGIRGIKDVEPDYTLQPGESITGVSGKNNPSVMNLMISAAQILEGVPEGRSLDNSEMQKIMAVQGELDRRSTILQENMATLGARHSQVIQAQETVVSDLQDVKTQISDVEDVDIQSATIEMALANMAYQASLSATQRVVQPSLLDYLR